MTAHGALRSQDHAAAFFDQPADFAIEVARYAADGLNRAESVVIIATDAHIVAIDSHLADYGYDARQLRLAGRYIALDPAETLESLTVDGVLDAEQFSLQMGAVIDAAGADGCPVRAFSETAALLWEAGEIAAAIQLEGFGDALARERSFGLLCGYPASALRHGSIADATRVCDAHSGIVAPRSYLTAKSAQAAGTGPSHFSDVLLPTAAAVPVARRFVASVLRPWAAPSLVDKAEQVTSEFATSAVNHAVSAFRVHLARSERMVRITVRDIGADRPGARHTSDEVRPARELAVTARLAAAWGSDIVDEGEQVWAELSLLD